jgi:hypothetical protein
MERLAGNFLDAWGFSRACVSVICFFCRLEECFVRLLGERMLRFVCILYTKEVRFGVHCVKYLTYSMFAKFRQRHYRVL